MLASVNVSDVTHNQFYVLSKFALTYPRLRAGGALLPDLIEFYQWIHRQLAYLVTRNYAQRHGLEEIISKADQKDYLFQLYDRVKGLYFITLMCVCIYPGLLIHDTCNLITAKFNVHSRWLQQVCRSDGRKHRFREQWE